MIAVCKPGSISLKQEHRDSAIISNQFQVWFAGYIANRAEVAQALNTNADETIVGILVRLYQKYGVHLACQIAGTLSWVIFDPFQRILCAASSRSGENTLYYTQIGHELWISDNIKSLLTVPRVSKGINFDSVLLHLGCRAPLPSATFYKHISRLQNGCWLQSKDGKLETGRYWEIEHRPVLRLKNDHEYAEALKDLLFEVIPQHIPSGSFAVTLSGGMDSTTVAAVLRNARPNAPIIAVSHISPTLPEADESACIIETAQRLSLSLNTIRADLHWTLSSPEGLSPDQSTPFVLFFAEIWQEIFRTIQQLGVATIFSGSPGDLLFGGNVNGYPDLLLSGEWAELARQVRQECRSMPQGSNLLRLIGRKVLKPVLKAYLPFRRKLIPPKWLHPHYHEAYVRIAKNAPVLRKILPGRNQRLELLNYDSIPFIREHMSTNARAIGIEIRHPLGDHRLMEFAACLPTYQTVRANQRKIILRNAMRPYLPESVIDRFPKVLPSSIGHYGLRQKESAKVWVLLSDMCSADLGYIDPFSLRQAYQDYLDGKTNDTSFWNALTLEAWLRRWF